MEFSKIKTVLFDIDGVLLHVTDADGNYLWRQNIESDLGIKNGDASEFFTSPTWQAIIRGKLDMEKELDRFLKGRGYSTPAREFIAYFHRKNYIPNESTISAAACISKKYKTYLATNQDEGRTRHLWNNHFSKLGFSGYFASYKVGAPKPQKEYWQAVVLGTKLAPSELLLIDDSHSNTDSAGKFGMQTYLYRSFELAQEELFTPLLGRKTPRGQLPRS
jgi:putative hydrolase of the HAD superfamily